MWLSDLYDNRCEDKNSSEKKGPYWPRMQPTILASMTLELSVNGDIFAKTSDIIV